MKFLFLKKSLAWPRATGHDVHTFYLADALARLGHSIGLALVSPPDERAVAGLPLELGIHRLGGMGTNPAADLNRIQRRFLRYWGIDLAWLGGAAELVARLRPDVVVASGFDLVPCLAAVRGPRRVWYIADEYARHHLTMLKLRDPTTWRHVSDACICAAYEHSYANCYDRAWVVSRDEAIAMRWLGGARAIDVIVNGVDGDRFAPGHEPRTSRSCVFWGRLDSQSNIQALEWFCREVWPSVRRLVPDARFSILGFAPTGAIRRWQALASRSSPTFRTFVRKFERTRWPSCRS